jgi:CRISPR/Cas system-associated exonuclease Cas4 (RecB family)
MTRTITKTYNVIDFRTVLLEGLRKNYNIPRTSVHASDLVNCRRQVCFERIAGKRNFSEETLMYFCSGEFQHQKLQSILGDDYDCEREIIQNDIIYHPDVIYKPDNAVIEIKTARTETVIKEPKATHVKQLKFYMGILNAPYGILQYIILNKFEGGMFPSHLITFKDERERQEILARLEADAAELQYGIDTKDPSVVGHIATDWDYMIKFKDKNGEMRTNGVNWLCKSCEFKRECDTMRASAGEFKAKTDAATAEKDKKRFSYLEYSHKMDDLARQNLPEAWK